MKRTMSAAIFLLIGAVSFRRLLELSAALQIRHESALCENLPREVGKRIAAERLAGAQIAHASGDIVHLDLVSVAHGAGYAAALHRGKADVDQGSQENIGNRLGDDSG